MDDEVWALQQLLAYKWLLAEARWWAEELNVAWAGATDYEPEELPWTGKVADQS